MEEKRGGGSKDKRDGSSEIWFVAAGWTVHASPDAGRTQDQFLTACYL
jgi:hypothetical protein